ncbi:MAG: hypothetical protein COX20_13490 [Desulfobacterales bacterium CG23_combo_of_CG06-09_8_20_14_all_52_9]|nr:MAG: hypothetical protein COX20_13490 [Desulfobacterales bacterium CG23_combo_of_CG06-09_8_20_14_all_52_9]
MTQRITPPEDNLKIRCRKLGHQIFFSYCRRENRGLPCPKTIDCWHIHFQVQDYLEQELTHEEWNQAFAAPAKPKVMTLLDLIEQAKAAKEEGSG